jgi:hypothetical protein
VPNPVQFDVVAGALPEGLSTDPQGLLEAFAERLTITPSVPWSSFVVGAAKPTSDVGPWFKDGKELWVWDNVTAAYVPLVSAAVADVDGGALYPTLRYAVSSLAPDPTKYAFWITLNEIGKAIDIRHYSTGAWRSIFEDTFAGITANYSTTAQMNTAISAAVDPVRVNYPVRASMTVTQTVGIVDLATPTKLLFNSTDFDPDTAYDTANSRFIAPVNGIYAVSAELQVDNNTGTVASMEMAFSILKNSGVYHSSGMSVASPPGARWYPQVSSLVQLATGDRVEFALALDDTVSTGNVFVAAGNSTANIHLVRRV